MKKRDLIRAGILLGASLGMVFMVALLYPQEHYAWTHWKIRELGVSDVEDKGGQLLVDVRPRVAYEQGHIPGAISLPEQGWDEALAIFLEQWEPERIVVIYCGGQACAASKHVALRLLKDLPDAKIYVLRGGFPAWEARYESMRAVSR